MAIDHNLSLSTTAGPELAVVVPTLNERDNVPLLIERLETALAGGRRSSSMTIPPTAPPIWCARFSGVLRTRCRI
jgi:hypothetical protein